jgi:cytochrome c peroxidase
MRKIFVLLAFVVAGFGLSAYVNEPDKTIDIIGLGKLLFFDSILSRDYTVSCATCHKPEFAFSDTVMLSVGVQKRLGTRNTPSAMNLSLQDSYFWDGRAKTLEQQALIPIENPVEMDTPIDTAIARLKESNFYSNAFREVFAKEPDRESLAKALATFQRTLETSESPFDNWRMNDDEEGISASVKRGFELFNNKGKCIQCHFGPDFNNIEFRNIGLFDGKNFSDSGRAAITGDPADLGKFKIGPLRNVAITAPYMHNGMFKTLEEVVEFYNDPEKIIPGSLNRDPLLSEPLNLTAQEQADIVEFLKSLTDKRFLKKTS